MKFALAGNPNSGKTTLFNSLTGSTAHVGNWPGVTVDKREGIYKKGGINASIVDLPGIYSLSPYTDEEIISRNFIIEEKPDCIIDVVDSTNFERNLYLTTQLLEMDVPVVVALNMTDLLEQSGRVIDDKLLEKELGVPVVRISALKKKNLNELMKVAAEAAETKRNGVTVLNNLALTNLIYEVCDDLKDSSIDNPLFHAVKICECDEIVSKKFGLEAKKVNEFKETLNDELFGNDLDAIVADARYKYITANYAKCLKTKDGKNINDNQRNKLNTSDKIDKILTHRWLGLLIFAVIVFLLFHFTFSTDLLYLNAMGAFGENGLVSFEGNPYFEGLFANGGINSIGVFFQNLVIGFNDFIGDNIRNGLANAGAAPWVDGLLVDGIWGGISAVLSFLPQILLLFLFFSIMEDTGYMARVAFIFDRIFRQLGLSGRSFIPMIMGFGCSVPAMINTRTLPEDKDKIATIRVIPFFSCGAKLPILTAFAGCIALQFGSGHADLISFGFYILGVAIAICTLILMSKTTLRGQNSPFIMELPEYHVPQFKSLCVHLWDKMKDFIKKAFTIILFSTIIIWFLSHFTWNWQYVSDEQMNLSILAGLGQLIQPILTPAGFGSQLGTYGWVFAVAAITGLIAKENCIATIAVLATTVIAATGANPEIASTLANIEGAGEVAQLALITGATVPSLLAFACFNLLTIPCFAAVSTAKAELPKNKFWSTIAFWLLTSYIVSSIIYTIGSWWWTLFIWMGAIALMILFITLWNKKHPINNKKAIGGI